MQRKEMECPGEKLNSGGVLRQCYGDLSRQSVAYTLGKDSPPPGSGWHLGT